LLGLAFTLGAAYSLFQAHPGEATLTIVFRLLVSWLAAVFIAGSVYGIVAWSWIAIRPGVEAIERRWSCGGRSGES